MMEGLRHLGHLGHWDKRGDEEYKGVISSWDSWDTWDRGSPVDDTIYDGLYGGSYPLWMIYYHYSR